MIEIGGYFGLEQSSGNGEYYPGLTALNTARNALVYVCKAKNIKKLYLPYFLCDTASAVCDRENINYGYYHITEDFLPVFDLQLMPDEYIYIVNYYGQLSEKQIEDFRQRYKNIILDNVQAFFTKPAAGIDTIYSCRKFVGVPDGAYLSTDGYIEGLEKDNSEDRLKHIYGRIKDGANAHYQEFKESEESLYSLPLRLMSDKTHELLKNIDYNEVKRKREENFLFLHNRLADSNKLRLICPEGPYAYPFYTENASGIRKLLAEKKIYVAKLWPNVTEGDEAVMADNILPLPCDQRYSLENINTILEELNNVRTS